MSGSTPHTPLGFFADAFRQLYACRGNTELLRSSTAAFKQGPQCAVADFGADWKDISSKAIAWLAKLMVATLLVHVTVFAAGVFAARYFIGPERAGVLARSLALVGCSAAVFGCFVAIVESAAAGAISSMVGVLLGSIVLFVASGHLSSTMFTRSHDLEHLGYVSGGASIGGAMGTTTLWLAEFSEQRQSREWPSAAQILNVLIVFLLLIGVASLAYALSQRIAIGDASKFAAILALPASLAAWFRLAGLNADLKFGQVLFGGGVAAAFATTLTGGLLALSGAISPPTGTLLEGVDNGCLAGGAIACAFVLVVEILMRFLPGRTSLFAALLLVLFAWAAVVSRLFESFAPGEKIYTIAWSVLGAVLGVAILYLIQRVTCNAGRHRVPESNDAS